MKGSIKIVVLLLCVFYLHLPKAFAHEIRPAYLEITETEENTFSILWKIPRVGEMVPNIKPVFPASFNVSALGIPEQLGESFIYHYNMTGREALNGQEITIEGLPKTMIDALVKVSFRNGESATLLLQPSNPSDMIPEKTDTWSIIKSYTHLGIEHIWSGIDHLLFVLALILITHGALRILKTITAFTIAHSITLSLAVLGFVHVPGPPVEAVIALSIVFLALEIINDMKGKLTITGRKPWLVAFTFGLLHGLGFASALAQVGLPQNDIPLALAFFNVGVEFGQLAFIVVVLLIIRLLSIKKNWSFTIQRFPAYVIGSFAAFWLMERIVAFWS